MPTTSEAEAFAQRLKKALDSCNVRPSPTIVANEFNLRYWGRSITPHTARNCGGSFLAIHRIDCRS
ncbi:MAG: hypothetical protein EBS87_11545, partial [Sphingomonadaceae bacterium]|nr:hypothetical protein [Sphingomonadaceae bacterium]